LLQVSDAATRADARRGLGGFRRGATLVASLVAILALSVPAVATASARGLITGFADSVYLTPHSDQLWLRRTLAAGARLVLLPADWAAIEPRPPARGSDPSNPANPAFHWGTLDQAVRAATAHHLTVALTVAGSGGPPWADGPGRPANAPPGTWKPNPAAFAAFAAAVARRFSGHYNPGGGVLPRVRYYEAWSEPNLPDHLNPQWVRVHGHPVAVSPIIYRGLLNAFYFAVKSVQRSDQVISGGLAPFGAPPAFVDPSKPLFDRVPPALFLRRLLCLSDSLRPLRCRHPAHLDILGDHPYSFGGPFQHAFNRDDVAVPDLRKLTVALAVAARSGRLFPRGPKPVWVTEFAWDSDPPEPHAVPMARWTRWIEEAFYELWREGVSAIAWYEIVDRPLPSAAGSLQEGGMYFADGRPKRGLAAFRFPFVVEPASGRRQVLWGISPRAGRVLVQQRSGARWLTRWRFRRGTHAIFTQTVTVAPGTLLRARVGGALSVPWRVR